MCEYVCFEYTHTGTQQTHKRPHPKKASLSLKSFHSKSEQLSLSRSTNALYMIVKIYALLTDFGLSLKKKNKNKTNKTKTKTKKHTHTHTHGKMIADIDHFISKYMRVIVIRLISGHVKKILREYSKDLKK